MNNIELEKEVQELKEAGEKLKALMPEQSVEELKKFIKENQQLSDITQMLLDMGPPSDYVKEALLKLKGVNESVLQEARRIIAVKEGSGDATNDIISNLRNKAFKGEGESND